MQLDQSLNLQCFYHDCHVVDSWKIPCEVTIHNDGEMRSKDDFCITIRDHEEEIEAIKTYADELTQAKHYVTSDIAKRKKRCKRSGVN